MRRTLDPENRGPVRNWIRGERRVGMSCMSRSTVLRRCPASEWAITLRCSAAWCLALAFWPFSLWGCGSPGSAVGDGGTPLEAGRPSATGAGDKEGGDGRAAPGSGNDSGASDDGGEDSGEDSEDSGEDAGCTWNLGTGVPEGAAPTLDNSADMTGATFGTDAFDATQQRRTVPIDVTTPLPGLSLGEAYLTGVASTPEAAYLILAVTNSGTDFPCYVQTTTYNWLSATGEVLNAAGTIYLDGSVGAVSSLVNSETCLAPGETGYLTDLQLATTGTLYSEVASIQIGLESTATGSTPTSKLVPTRYDVGTCSGIRTVRIEGTASAPGVSVGNFGGDFAPAVFLDAAGLPVRWSYFSQMQAANVASGATTYFTDNLTEPAVSRALVFLSFEPPDPTLMSLSPNLLHEMRATRAARRERARRWQLAVRSLSSWRPPVASRFAAASSP
jgi:hypothetical protein